MYKVKLKHTSISLFKKGKFARKVNLDGASQETLKELYDLGHTNVIEKEVKVGKESTK